MTGEIAAAVWVLLGAALGVQLAFVLKEMRGAFRAAKETCMLAQDEMKKVCREVEAVCRQAQEILTDVKGHSESVAPAFKIIGDSSRKLIHLQEACRRVEETLGQNPSWETEGFFWIFFMLSRLRGWLGGKEAP